MCRPAWAAQDGYVLRPLVAMASGRHRQFHAPEHARMMPARGWQNGRMLHQPQRMQLQGHPAMQQRQAPMQHGGGHAGHGGR